MEALKGNQEQQMTKRTRKRKAFKKKEQGRRVKPEKVGACCGKYQDADWREALSVFGM